MKRYVTLFALLILFAIGAQAQIVGANEGKKTSTNTTSPLYKPTGHYLRAEGGLIWGSIAYDYQINPYTMVGGGIGICTDDREQIMFPIYAEAIFSTPRYKWSFYTEVKMGYDVFNKSFFPSLTIGGFYKNFGLGVGCYYYSTYAYHNNYSTDYRGVTFRIVATYKLPLKVHR